MRLHKLVARFRFYQPQAFLRGLIASSNPELSAIVQEFFAHAKTLTARRLRGQGRRLSRSDVHRIEEAARFAAPDARMILPILRRHRFVLVEVPLAIDDELVARFNDPRNVDGRAVVAAAAAHTRCRVADARVPVMRFSRAEKSDAPERQEQPMNFCC